MVSRNDSYGIKKSKRELERLLDDLEPTPDHPPDDLPHDWIQYVPNELWNNPVGALRCFSKKQTRPRMTRKSKRELKHAVESLSDTDDANPNLMIVWEDAETGEWFADPDFEEPLTPEVA